MDFPLIKYEATARIYSALNGNGQKIYAQCNHIEFRNTGTGTVIINDSVQLLQSIGGTTDDTFIVPGNIFEFDETQYTISFGDPAGGQVTVIRKYYKDIALVTKIFNLIINHK